MSRTFGVVLCCLCLLVSGCGADKEENENASGNGEGGGEKKLVGGMDSKNPTNNYLLLSRNRAMQAQVVNNLKMVVLAMHQYHDQNGSFPPVDEGQLSWRVRILPQLGQSGLYEQFKLNEPWDSPHNKALISKMPDVYRTTTSTDHTSLMTFVGNGAMYDGGQPPSFRQMSDGTSNTIVVIVGGADKAVPWTMPQDLPFNPSDPYAEIGDVGDTLIFATADGAVFPRAKSSIPADTLKALITKSGGEIVSF